MSVRKFKYILTFLKGKQENDEDKKSEGSDKEDVTQTEKPKENENEDRVEKILQIE